MFQDFTVSSNPEQGPPRLADLREQLTIHGLDGFLIPRADAHQGEYVSARDARLAWLTGFTGSAGFCAALIGSAGVFVDGRYRVQVKSEIDLDHFTPVDWPETSLGAWLKQALPDGGKVGYDAWLHTAGELEATRKALQGTDIRLHSAANLVDRIWPDQPGRPLGKIIDYPIEFAGKSSKEKRTECAAELTKPNHSAAVLSLPDSIAWLLNIRGSDIERNPIVQCFAILHASGRVSLFTDPAKAADLPSDPDIDLLGWDQFEPALRGLHGTVRVDKSSAPAAVADILNAAGVAMEWGDDPCRMPKAIKNPVEIQGTTEAHLRDGAAMVEFLAWFDAEAPMGGLHEIDVVTQLEGFRRATNSLRDISFETIAGTGANGAIMHYRVSETSNSPLKQGQLIVVDSGGQYFDGTTDITRTMAIGAPDAEQIACFTRVLQGMIAISRARFPQGVGGAHLDALARAPLWMAGLDFDHGTGHGVGVYLCVHEGPQRLSRTSDLAFQPGMILSNEPGYYREGAFGIRIENLIVVEKAPPLKGADKRNMNAFKTLTFVPIDRSLIDVDMLSRPERDWLNTYHSEVLEKIAPRVQGDTLVWLQKATAPI